MFKYALQRLGYMLLVFLIITFMCFVLIRMLPEAPLMPGDVHSEIIEARREAMGYNKPYLVQFGIFLKNVFTKLWSRSCRCIHGEAARFHGCKPVLYYF